MLLADSWKFDDVRSRPPDVCAATSFRPIAEGTNPAGFRLLQSEISPSGVIIASYESAGEVKTGSFGLVTPSEAELARRKRLKEEG